MFVIQKKREKLFGSGKPRPLDRNAKARIMIFARAKMRRTERGKAYGAISAKAYAVLEAILWAFHNAGTGLCFPSYETIAKRASCARSTVAQAIKQLERAGILSWVNRIKRVQERCEDLFGRAGTRLRVLRTSNAYHFNDPTPSNVTGEGFIASKSDLTTGTSNQLSYSYQKQKNELFETNSALQNALLKLGNAVKAASQKA